MHKISVYKVKALASLSVSTISVPPVIVVKVTTTPTYQHTNPASKHAIVRKPVFSTSHVLHRGSQFFMTIIISTKVSLCKRLLAC